MTNYTAWVKNDQGASESITWRDGSAAEWSSKRAAADYARRRYGSGWRVIIENNHGQTVDSFRIR